MQIRGRISLVSEHFSAWRDGHPTRSTSDSRLSYFLPCFFRFAAQYAFILVAAALRFAALMPCRFFPGAGVGVTAAINGFLGGRPLLRAGPCNTSMARLSRSRSAMSNASIWSVGISQESTTGLYCIKDRAGVWCESLPRTSVSFRLWFTNIPSGLRLTLRYVHNDDEGLPVPRFR
jgi:hypothetical protein